MTEDYVSFEVAKLLKDKGFNDPFTHMFINKDNVKFDCSSSGVVPKETIACPTHQMAMKWLRQEKNIIINVWYNGVDWDAEYYNDEDENFYPITDSSCNSYEEAVESALKYSLENLI